MADLAPVTFDLETELDALLGFLVAACAEINLNAIDV